MSAAQTNFLGASASPTPKVPAQAKHLAKRNDPDSSHDAAGHMIQSGTLSAHECFVIDLVGKNPGLTANELGAIQSRLSGVQINRRLSSLENRGFLRRGDKRKCTVGRPACPWFLITEKDKDDNQ